MKDLEIDSDLMEDSDRFEFIKELKAFNLK